MLWKNDGAAFTYHPIEDHNGAGDDPVTFWQSGQPINQGYRCDTPIIR